MPTRKPTPATIPFRRIIVIGVALAGVAWVVVSAFSGRGGVSGDVDLPRFADAGGAIRVSLSSSGPEGREWNFKIHDGRLARSDIPADPEESATYRYFGGPEGYTPPENRIFRRPFLFSPDGKYLASGVMLPDTVAFGENKRYAFAVLELETSSFSVLDELSKWKAMGLAWSPDSRRVVILRRAQRVGNSPSEFLSRIFTHPTFYSTWVVELVDPTKGVMGTVEVAWNIRASRGWISWVE